MILLRNTGFQISEESLGMPCTEGHLEILERNTTLDDPLTLVGNIHYLTVNMAHSDVRSAGLKSVANSLPASFNKYSTLHHMLDWGDFQQGIAPELGSDFSGNLIIIEFFYIKPEHRGLGFAKSALNLFVKSQLNLGAGRDTFITLDPWPLGFDEGTSKFNKAVKWLKKFYSGAGFSEVPDSNMMLLNMAKISK